jgi:hypothetical protein
MLVTIYLVIAALAGLFVSLVFGDLIHRDRNHMLYSGVAVVACLFWPISIVVVIAIFRRLRF